jgi:hypothetical protein
MTTETVFKAGDEVVSSFHVRHMVKAAQFDGDGYEWVTLADGREFAAHEFRPYVAEFHGRMAFCEQCSPCDAGCRAGHSVDCDVRRSERQS